MRKKLINKASLKNIFIRKSTWILVAVFIVGIITIPNFISKAGSNPRSIEYDDVARVLEVGPGDGYLLEGGRQTVDGIDVEVTQMSMPEFISRTDELSGYYDAIVIDRNKDGLQSKFVLKYDETSAKNYKYVDYSAALTNQMPIAHYTMADKPKQGKTLPYSYEETGRTDDKRYFTEFYSENDITDRRTKEVIKMLDNNQLVYIDADIMDSTTLKDTKLVNNFKNTNYTKINHGDIQISKIVSDYKNNVANQRPYISKLVASNDDSDITTKDSKGNVWGNISSRSMEFNISVANADNYKAKLYFDINADGIYTDNELENTFDLSKCKIESGLYKLTATLDSYFVGYLDWKIEIIKDDGVSSYVTYHSVFKAIDEKHKRNLKVLQIFPKSATINMSNLLYLCDYDKDKTAQQVNFRKILESDVIKNSGYDIDIDSVLYSDVNDKVKADSKYLDKYDMIIVGFADNYGGTCEISTKTCDAIDTFIASGKSCMFTHDTMTLNTFGNQNGTSDKWWMGVGPKVFGQRFRDYVGQARYVDPYRNSGKDSNASDIMEEDYNSTEENKVIIPHDTITKEQANKTAPSDNQVKNDNIYSMGTTLYSNNYDLTKTTKVKNINQAQITSYPFDLLNESFNVDGKTTDYQEKGYLPVAETHTQWYQLNLEDENVVPWFNLKSSVNNAGDSRNFYYTYSKGNITYSGTGHSSDYPEAELKLFINTIIKADRGANFAPTLNNYKVDTSKEDVSSYVPGTEIADGSYVQNDNNDGDMVIDKNEDFHFVTKINDLNKDDVKVTMSVDGAQITPIDTPNGQSIQSKYFPDGTQNVYKSGSDVGGYIDKAKIAQKEGSYITVKVTATDYHGAATSKTFRLKVKKNNPPEVTNYRQDHETTIANNADVYVTYEDDFNFNSIVKDLDEDICNAVVTLDDEEIYSEENVKLGEFLKEDITIPKETLDTKNPGDKFKVVVTATDSKGDTGTSSFNIVIKKPELQVLHSFYNKDNVEDWSIIDYKAKNMEEDIKAVGSAYNIFDANQVMKLTIPESLKLRGSIKLTVETNNNKEAEMTYTGTEMINGVKVNVYECPLTTDLLGDIPKKGARVKVDYSVDLIVMIRPDADIDSITYTNNLSVDKVIKPINVIDTKFKHDENGKPYLF